MMRPLSFRYPRKDGEKTFKFQSQIIQLINEVSMNYTLISESLNNMAKALTEEAYDQKKFLNYIHDAFKDDLTWLGDNFEPSDTLRSSLRGDDYEETVTIQDIEFVAHKFSEMIMKLANDFANENYEKPEAINFLNQVKKDIKNIAKKCEALLKGSLINLTVNHLYHNGEKDIANDVEQFKKEKIQLSKYDPSRDSMTIEV